MKNALQMDLSQQCNFLSSLNINGYDRQSGNGIVGFRFARENEVRSFDIIRSI